MTFYGFAKQFDGPMVGLNKGEHAAHGCTFSCAIGAQKAINISWIDGDVDILNGMKTSKTFGKVFDANNWI